MEKSYWWRRRFGRVLHESESYFISTPVMGDEIEVLEKASDRVITPSELQLAHLEACKEELERLLPADDDASVDVDTDPLHVLVEDFANAVFHNGQHLERAFFKLSPKSRAASALARTGITAVVQRETSDPFYDEW